MIAQSNQKNSPIAVKLWILNAVIIISSIMGILVAYELKKGAKLHELNFLHLKYNSAFFNAVHDFKNNKNTHPENLKEPIKKIREQPAACLALINWGEEQFLDLINTDYAIKLCKKDLELANKTIDSVNLYEEKKINKPDLVKVLEIAIKGFHQHSTDFGPLVYKTVQSIFAAILFLVVLKSLGVIAIGFHISRRISFDYQKLKTAEERFDVSVRGSSVGLWDWNVLTNELYWSPRFKEIVGITDEDFRPHLVEFESRLHKQDHDRVMGALQDHLEKRTPYDVEYQLLHDDGNYRWIHALGQAIWDEKGNPIRMAGSVDDITERKNIELSLEKHTQDLEKSNQALEDFAHITSHDLKEPLRGIHNHIMVLQEDYGQSLEEEGNRRVNRVLFLVQAMEELIHDLHHYSSIDRQDLAYDENDLNQIVDNIKEVFLDEKDLSITTTETLPTIYCDGIRVKELFRNLIGNAIKYNDSDKKHIEVGHAINENTPVYYVKDNGIGIDPQFHSDIFRIFKQLHTKDTYQSGSGSGLTIAKKIVECHNGRIWLESEPG